MLSVIERLLRLTPRKYADSLPANGGPQRARVVAGARRLDLDHVGAHVAQHHRAQRPRQYARQIEHAQPVERAAGLPSAGDSRVNRG